MSEKDPLLYSSSSNINVASKVANVVGTVTRPLQEVEAVIKSQYTKAIQRIHARDFFAEFLATFILVVSFI